MKEPINQLDITKGSCNFCQHHDKVAALLKLISFSVEDVKAGRVVSSIKLKEKLSVRKGKCDK